MDNSTLNTWRRVKDSDIYYSFIKSPTAIISSIILNRGGFGWTFSVRGQRGVGSAVYGRKSFLGAGIPSGDQTKNESFTDLLRGSVSLNVLSKNGIQAEEIAKQKMEDLNANDLEEASKIIAGSARSMGIEVKE